jgi:hypothetical protein
VQCGGSAVQCGRAVAAAVASSSSSSYKGALLCCCAAVPACLHACMQGGCKYLGRTIHVMCHTHMSQPMCGGLHDLTADCMTDHRPAQPLSQQARAAAGRPPPATPLLPHPHTFPIAAAWAAPLLTWLPSCSCCTPSPPSWRRWLRWPCRSRSPARHRSTQGTEEGAAGASTATFAPQRPWVWCGWHSGRAATTPGRSQGCVSPAAVQQCLTLALGQAD